MVMTFVDVDFPKIDIEERVVSRTLLQFRQSPVFLSILSALAAEIQAFIDATRDVMRYRTVTKASGYNLEVLSRIVGQLHNLVNISEYEWFAPDVPGISVDQTPVWVVNAATGGQIPISNEFSRIYVMAKICRNAIKYGSVPEIQQFVKSLFGIDVSIVSVGVMTVVLVVPDETSNNTLMLLQGITNTLTSESVFLVPVPAGVSIYSVVRISDYDPENHVFRDTEGNEWKNTARNVFA